MTAEEPRPGNAVEKVLDVLDSLVEHARLSDLARAAGLPKSTVHRILQTLVMQGFAAFDDVSGTYSPGARLLRLAGRTLGRFNATIGAEPALRRLQERTAATVHLAVLAGDEAVYVRKLEGNKPYHMVSRIGMAIPLHCTGIGKAILAGMSDEEVRAVVDRAGLPAHTSQTLSSLDGLLDELELTRRNGWAADRQENEVGIVCAGSGVRDHGGRVNAAVSVSQLHSDPTGLTLDEIGPMVAATAAEISTGMGAFIV